MVSLLTMSGLVDGCEAWGCTLFVCGHSPWWWSFLFAVAVARFLLTCSWSSPVVDQRFDVGVLRVTTRFFSSFLVKGRSQQVSSQRSLCPCPSPLVFVTPRLIRLSLLPFYFWFTPFFSSLDFQLVIAVWWIVARTRRPLRISRSLGILDPKMQSRALLVKLLV